MFISASSVERRSHPNSFLISGLLVWVKMRPVGQECAQGQTVSCVTLAMDLAQAGSTVESKIYDTLQWQVRGSRGDWGGQVGTGLLGVTFLSHPLPLQIWTLLPGFCTRPTDVATAFKGLARTLGTAISERPDLRVTVCQALRSLITKGCEAGMCGVRPGGRWLRGRGFPDPVWSARCLSYHPSFARA